MKLGFFLIAALLQHWLFVSDIHLDPYASGSRIRAYHPGDTAEPLWKSALREMRARVPDARVIVLGGDMLAHDFASLARRNGANPETAAIATAKGIAAGLAAAFPRAQFIVALGNNDDPCGDYRSEIGGSYQNALARVWEPLVDRNGAAPGFAAQFVRGGYYTVKLPGNERAIVLNSVLWSFVYRGSCSGSARNPGASELTWLREQLGRPGSGRDVVVMHIPVGYDALSTTTTHRFLAVPFLNGPADRALLDMFGDDSRIAFALAAHVHRYAFRIAGDVPMLIGSSISPVYRNNPAFYALEVDGAGTLHDVVPYVYDLMDGDWHAQPSFDATYGVDDFTTANLKAISARIERDPSLREKWIEAYDVWSWRMGDIADHRWRVFWCAQTEQNGGYAACAGTQNRFATVVAVAVVALLVALAGLGVLIRRKFIVRR